MPAGGAGQGREPEKRRRVEFQDVTIYRFARRQGYVCVPSQGGNTLGMEDQHYGVEVVTVDEHAADRRRESREAELEGVEGEVEAEEEEEEEGEDFTSILLPVDSKERRVVLRRAGTQDIDTREKEECREVRASRQACGCTCALYCLPDSCDCAREGVSCQADRPGFPCTCTAEGCLNKAGRLEFNPVKVRTHFVRTIMRTRLEEARCLQPNPAYLPYLASMYTPEPSWLPAWPAPDQPWWFSSQAGAAVEQETEESIANTESEDSEEEEEEILADEEDEEEEQCVTEVVTDETRLVSQSEVDTMQIINEVLEAVEEHSGNNEVGQGPGEGVGQGARPGSADEDEGMSSDLTESESESKADLSEESSVDSGYRESGSPEEEAGLRRLLPRPPPRPPLVTSTPA